MNLPSTAQSEHRYFSVIALAVTMTVLAGFVPLYTLRLLRHDPNLTLLVHAHGFVMTAWIALFLAQTLLIAKRRIDLHRRLGFFGVGLALLVLMIGVPTLIHAAARRSHDVHSTRFLWMLIAFDGIALVVFAGLVGAAVLLRQRGDYHKRLMLLATLSLLGPAFGRLTAYANGLRGDSDVGVLLLCAGIVLACAAVDGLRSHRVHPVILLGWGVSHWHGCGDLRRQTNALDGWLAGESGAVIVSGTSQACNDSTRNRHKSQTQASQRQK